MIVRNWLDLEHFGIRYLTGEADSTGTRILLDLTEEGAALVEEYLGGTVGIRRGTNWNSGAVASVMLPRSGFKPLAVFCLLRENPVAVVFRDGAVAGFGTDRREAVDGVGSGFVIERYGSWDRTPSRSPLRNVHAMSGRVV